jgi:type I restriction enzyme M protein
MVRKSWGRSPDELAEEIIENLEAGLTSFRQVLAGLNKTGKAA